MQLTRHTHATVRSLSAAFAVLAAALPDVAGAADEKTALPILSACRQSTAPQLPERWRAVALMLPFTHQQLDVGEFIYDGALPALRATLYGLESGAVDLLITEKETYQFAGPTNSPDACVAFGPKYNPPAANWLAGNAVCDGEAPLMNTVVEWWKSAADGRAQWQWYKSATRLPWRTMFASRSSEPAVIGDYGMSYFPTFAPLAETNLAHLRDVCAAKAKKPARRRPRRTPRAS